MGVTGVGVSTGSTSQGAGSAPFADKLLDIETKLATRRGWVEKLASVSVEGLSSNDRHQLQRALDPESRAAQLVGQLVNGNAHGAGGMRQMAAVVDNLRAHASYLGNATDEVKALNTVAFLTQGIGFIEEKLAEADGGVGMVIEALDLPTALKERLAESYDAVVGEPGASARRPASLSDASKRLIAPPPMPATAPAALPQTLAKETLAYRAESNRPPRLNPERRARLRRQLSRPLSHRLEQMLAKLEKPSRAVPSKRPKVVKQHSRSELIGEARRFEAKRSAPPGEFYLQAQNDIRKHKLAPDVFTRVIGEWRLRHAEYRAILADESRPRDERVSVVLKLLHAHYYARYGREEAQVLNFFDPKLRMGNCVAFTTLVNMALQEMPLEPGEHRAVQVFADHVHPVVYNTNTGQVWDLVANTRTLVVEAPTYDEALLAHAYLAWHGLAKSDDVKAFLLHPGPTTGRPPVQASKDDSGLMFPPSSVWKTLNQPPRYSRNPAPAGSPKDVQAPSQWSYGPSGTESDEPEEFADKNAAMERLFAVSEDPHGVAPATTRFLSLEEVNLAYGENDERDWRVTTTDDDHPLELTLLITGDGPVSGDVVWFDTLERKNRYLRAPLQIRLISYDDDIALELKNHAEANRSDFNALLRAFADPSMLLDDVPTLDPRSKVIDRLEDIHRHHALYKRDGSRAAASVVEQTPMLKLVREGALDFLSFVAKNPTVWLELELEHAADPKKLRAFLALAAKFVGLSTDKPEPLTGPIERLIETIADPKLTRIGEAPRKRGGDAGKSSADDIRMTVRPGPHGFHIEVAKPPKPVPGSRLMMMESLDAPGDDSRVAVSSEQVGYYLISYAQEVGARFTSMARARVQSARAGNIMGVLARTMEHYRTLLGSPANIRLFRLWTPEVTAWYRGLPKSDRKDIDAVVGLMIPVIAAARVGHPWPPPGMEDGGEFNFGVSGLPPDLQALMTDVIPVTAPPTPSPKQP